MTEIPISKPNRDLDEFIENQLMHRVFNIRKRFYFDQKIKRKPLHYSEHLKDAEEIMDYFVQCDFNVVLKYSEHTAKWTFFINAKPEKKYNYDGFEISRESVHGPAHAIAKVAYKFFSSKEQYLKPYC